MESGRLTIWTSWFTTPRHSAPGRIGEQTEKVSPAIRHLELASRKGIDSIEVAATALTVARLAVCSGDTHSGNDRTSELFHRLSVRHQVQPPRSGCTERSRIQPPHISRMKRG